MTLAVCFATIHNNDERRNAQVRDGLRAVLDTLPPEVSARTVDVSYQPQLSPYGVSRALFRDLVYKAIERKYRRYCLIKPRLLPSDLAGLVRDELREIFYRDGGAGRWWRKNRTVEAIVTDKHIRAMLGFLESHDDILVCLEDDAVFLPDSALRIRELLQYLSGVSAETAVYVDLAGGCKRENLLIDQLELEKSPVSSFRRYSRPVTNTACAYLLNARMASILHIGLLARPWLRLIGIDWMMNGLMAYADLQPCLCLHADPTVLNHGSKTGSYTSWQDSAPKDELA